MEDILNNIINTTYNSFDFTFCIIVNILTYTIIKLINDTKCKYTLNVWGKRIAFLSSAIIVTIFYISTGSDYKILFNSWILAPVSWSWILKPICNKLNIDYNTNI